MADFDPDAYLLEVAAAPRERADQAFDPDAYLASVKPDGGVMPRPTPTDGALTEAPPSGVEAALLGPWALLRGERGTAAGRGAVQGATAGFGDEINAAVQAMPDAARWLNPAGFLTGPLKGLADATSGVPASQRETADRLDAERDARRAGGTGGRLRAILEDYQQARNGDRAANEAAKAAHPGAYRAAELASGVPLAAALPGGQATGVGGMAAAGALQGGLGGLGGSTADLTQGDVGGAAKDTATGAGVGAALGAGAGLLGRLVSRAGEGIRGALADAASMASGKAQKAFRVARSALGGETAAAFQAIAKAEEIAQNAGGRYTAAQAADAAQWLSSPEVRAIAQNAADNLLAAGPERIAGSMQTARNVFEQARAGLDPGAIEQAADDLVSSPIRTQVLPRLKNYATRAIAPAVGAAVGGPMGAAAGFGAGAVMGNPGTALANMLKHPASRKLGWELLQLLGRAGSAPVTTATERSILNSTLESAPDGP